MNAENINKNLSNATLANAVMKTHLQSALELQAQIKAEPMDWQPTQTQIEFIQEEIRCLIGVTETIEDKFDDFDDDIARQIRVITNDTRHMYMQILTIFMGFPRLQSNTVLARGLRP